MSEGARWCVRRCKVVCQKVQGECVRRCKVDVSEGARWVCQKVQGGCVRRCKVGVSEGARWVCQKVQGGYYWKHRGVADQCRVGVVVVQGGCGIGDTEWVC